MDIPLKDIVTALATVTASLIAAFLGSLQGTKTALARFKKERGFDRRLTCYEDIAKQLGKAKLELESLRRFRKIRTSHMTRSAGSGSASSRNILASLLSSLSPPSMQADHCLYNEDASGPA